MKQEIENHGAELESTVCPVCGIVYAVQSSLIAVRRDRDESWHCPNGHTVKYAKSEAERLFQDNERKSNEISRLRTYVDGLNATASALRGQITKLKKGGKR